MNRDILIQVAIQSSVVFVVVWLALRLIPSIPANSKAWIWRLAFLKPAIGLLPFAVVPLRLLPASPESVNLAATSSESVVVSSTTVIAPLATARPVVQVDWLLVAWIASASAIVLWSLVKSICVARIARKATLVGGQTDRIVAELAGKAKVRRAPVILASAKVGTPVLVGLWRPKVILPVAMVDDANEIDLRLMLAHEIAHLARRDQAWLMGIWLIQTLFFFNPVAWLASRCARLDHESATDELASNLAAVPIQTYAEMLLRATVVARTPLAPGVLPMSEAYRTVHRRIEAMKYFKSKPSTWRKSAIIALAVTVMGMLPIYEFASGPNQPVSVAKPKAKAKSHKRTTHKKAKTSVTTAQAAKPKATAASIAMPGATQAAGASVPAAANTLPSIAVGVKPVAMVPAGGPSPAVDRVAIATGAPTSREPIAGSTVAADIPVSTSGPSTGAPTQGATGHESEWPHYDVNDPRVALRFESGDVRKVIKILCEQKHVNYILDEAVQGKITISLDAVSFDFALDLILKTVGATYHIEGGVYQIFPIKK